ncbi:MAG: hypothetical protein HQ596_01925 [Candidatus Saganbacteria bacterium]|nr:hypothetical protein [Candidatus Saganbacteria bacterium]
MFLAKLIAFETNEAKVAQLPTVETLLANLGDLTTEAVRLAGFPLTLQAIDQAIKSGQIETILKTNHVSAQKLWEVIHQITDTSPSSPFREMTFKVGPYSVKIKDPDPYNFTLHVVPPSPTVTVIQDSSPAEALSTVEHFPWRLSVKVFETGVKLDLVGKPFDTTEMGFTEEALRGLVNPRSSSINLRWRLFRSRLKDPFTGTERKHPLETIHLVENFNLREIIGELIQQIEEQEDA